MAPLPLAAGLAGAIGFLVASRLWELQRSSENERRLRARGGRLAFGGPPFFLFVALHTVFPLALAAEVSWAGARPGSGWPLWLALWIGAETLRFVAIGTLGDRWTTRVYIVPGEPRVRRGIYRFLPHPNYLGVALELAAVPLLFGAWRTAVFAGVANALLLAGRVRAESRALAHAERAPFDPGDRSE